MSRPLFSPGVPLLRSLARLGVEFDQKLWTAWLRTSGLSPREGRRDDELFLSLLRLNPRIAGALKLDALTAPLPESATDGRSRAMATPSSAGNPPDGHLADILKTAYTRRADERVVSTRDFLKALAAHSHGDGDDYGQRPYTVDFLMAMFHGLHRTRSPLRSSPSVRQVLLDIVKLSAVEDDFQYVLALEGNRVAFRVTSVLNDYIQRADSGILAPQRAILTHFKDSFGAFTEDEILELESLLNSVHARESDYQGFFERHRHFLRRWDHREVYPHVVLARPEGPLVPDFLLTDRELQRAAIVDLKLPGPLLVRRTHNRDRFSAAVMEAKTQLLRYRDWFRESANRRRLKGVVGMEIYEPQLIVIIGRTSEFEDEFDRRRLSTDHPEIEVVTYDDLVTFAKRRRLIIRPSNGW